MLAYSLCACQQAGDALEQGSGIEWLADMSRTADSDSALLFQVRDMSSDGNDGGGAKLTHLAQVFYGFPSIHTR